MYIYYVTHYIQRSSLISNFLKPTKFVLILRCSNYKFALNRKWKYNGLSRNNNHIAKLPGFQN